MQGQSREELLGQIRTSSKIFKMMGLEDSAEATAYLEVEARQRPLHRSILDSVFLGLQSMVWTDFAINEYRKKLTSHLSKRTHDAMSVNQNLLRIPVLSRKSDGKLLFFIIDF